MATGSGPPGVEVLYWSIDFTKSTDALELLPKPIPNSKTVQPFTFSKVRLAIAIAGPRSDQDITKAIPTPTTHAIICTTIGGKFGASILMPSTTFHIAAIAIATKANVVNVLSFTQPDKCPDNYGFSPACRIDFSTSSKTACLAAATSGWFRMVATFISSLRRICSDRSEITNRFVR